MCSVKTGAFDEEGVCRVVYFLNQLENLQGVCLNVLRQGLDLELDLFVNDCIQIKMLDADIRKHKVALLHPARRFDGPDLKLAWQQF